MSMYHWCVLCDSMRPRDCKPECPVGAVMNPDKCDGCGRKDCVCMAVLQAYLGPPPKPSLWDRIRDFFGIKA